MMHLPKSSFVQRTALAADTLLPLKPAHYLQLRREAASLSIDDVAAALAPRIFDRPAAAGLVRMLETPGFTARYSRTLQRLAKIFPFDPGVYRQLADEPADRHPRVCRSCGCSHWDPNPGDTMGNCLWQTPTMCTRCEGLAQ
jgi:hypothetical protein